MCGIVGVITTEYSGINNPVSDYFRQAIFMDTVRGSDSTGMFLMKSKIEKPELFKRALAAPDFLQLKKTADLLKDTNDWQIMIGHNRAATRGGVSDITAHPFQIDNITMVHNGTIFNHRTLKDGHKFDVDSEAICHAISHDGIEAVVDHMEGAFSLVWHDNNDGSINLVRNDERPLAFAKIKGKNTIFLASEAGMLSWLATRNGFAIESLISPKAGEMFSWKPSNLDKDWTESYTHKKLKLRKKVISQYGNYNNNGGYNGKKPVGGKTENISKVADSVVEKLSSLGLEYRETVVMTNIDFVQYSHGAQAAKSLFGRITGVIKHLNEEHTCEINGVSIKEWEKYVDGDEILSEVDGCWQRSNEPITVTLSKENFIFIDSDANTNESTDEDNDGIEEEEKSTSVDTFRGPNRTVLTQREWDIYTKKGCVQCGGNVFSEDADKTGWTHDKMPVCKHCITTCGFEDYLN